MSVRFVVIAILQFSVVKITFAEYPLLIAKQPQNIRESWFEVQNLFSNPNLGDESRIALLEARGDLWSIAGVHEEALSDYLEATKIALSRSPTLVEQSRLLDRIVESMERLEHNPLPCHPEDAFEAFNRGRILLLEGSTQNATDHLSEATRLDPKVPLYRAYLAIALKHLGETEKATQQAANAATLLRQSNFRLSGKVESLFHREMEFVPAVDRFWLKSAMTQISLGEASVVARAKLEISKAR